MVVLTNGAEVVEGLALSMAKVVNIKHTGTDENSEDENSEMKEDGAQLTAVKNKNQNLLSHFWNLATLDEAIRSESVVNLLDELKKNRKQADLDYTAQRLVKGLSSSRKAARQGFATALTHVMKEFSEITSDVILELMAKHLTVQGNFKGQEERDAYFGQVFGLLAIYRSKIQDCDPNLDVILVKKLIERLLILRKKKSYLQEICGTALCDILNSIDYLTFEKIQPMLETTLRKGWAKCTPEDLMMVLKLQSKFKNDLPATFFKEHWNHSEILHKSNFKEMSRVLMDTTNTAHPRVHVLWDIVLQYLLSGDEEGDSFEEFWKQIIQDGLLHSTHERKFLVMNIILKIAPKISANKVQIVFGESIIRCMINSCQSKMNYLYNSVRNMLSKLPECLAENEANGTIPLVIKSLVGGHGHVGFDSITKTKVVEELTTKVSHNLPAYYKWLQNVFSAGTTNVDVDKTEIPEKDVNECRSWVINQLILLLRISKTHKAESLLMEISNFLFFNAYFVAAKKNKKEDMLQRVPEIPVSDATHQFCRQRFNTALTELANIFHTKSQGGSKSIGGLAEDGEYYTWKILSFGKRLLEMPKYTQLVTVWTPEIYESWDHSLEQISTMQTEGNKSANSNGTQLLFIHATLQLFSNREEAVDILKELETCYKKAEEKRRKKKTEPHWTEVLTEILLGFMAQSSHLMRQVVDWVYPTILPHLTQEALDLLLKAIEPAKQNGSSAIQFENVSDMEEGDDEEQKDVNEVEEHVEHGEGNEKHADDADNESDNERSAEESDGSDENDDSEEESGDESSEFEVDETFKTELKVALGGSAVNSEEDTDEEENDVDDEDDIDMDTCDPNMLEEMDQALADVFRSRKHKQTEKKKKKERKLSVLHFKLRVLDLIEIFIKKQAKDTKVLLLLKPLYDVIRISHGNTEEQPLFERTLGIYKNKLCTLHEYPSGKDLDVDNVHGQIEDLVELAKSATSALLVTYITQGIIYLIRVLRGNPEIKIPSPRATRAQRKHKEIVTVKHQTSKVGCLNEERLIKCFKTALTEFMTKRSSHLQPVLFNELIQRFPSLGWQLATDLPQYINEGCNNFRKVKAFEMLKLLFSKKTENFEECLLGINKEIHTNLIKAFRATREENYSLKARHFHDIVNLANIYLKEISKYPQRSKEVDSISIKAAMSTAMAEALESPVVTRSSSLQSYCQIFLTTLDNVTKENVPTKKKKNQ